MRYIYWFLAPWNFSDNYRQQVFSVCLYAAERCRKEVSIVNSALATHTRGRRGKKNNTTHKHCDVWRSLVVGSILVTITPMYIYYLMMVLVVVVLVWCAVWCLYSDLTLSSWQKEREREILWHTSKRGRWSCVSVVACVSYRSLCTIKQHTSTHQHILYITRAGIYYCTYRMYFAAALVCVCVRCAMGFLHSRVSLARLFK